MYGYLKWGTDGNLSEGIFYRKLNRGCARNCTGTLLKGRVVKRLLYKKPEKEQLVAMFNDIDFFKLQKKIALRNCGNIDPLNIEEYIAADGYLA